MSAARAPLRPGARLLPGYAVLSHLARGRELDVYDVWSEERDCRCVAKTLVPGAREAGDAAARRLRAEGLLLRRLSHPHLVRAYDVAEHEDGRPAVILETLEGATLSWVVREGGVRLTAGDLAHLGRHLCSAASYLHRHGRLHLDLKPSNVISDAGRAKIIDLNLARRPGRVPSGWGTAQYLSPEQARGERAEAASDVWGIGATLWTAATGERPFSGSGKEQLARRAEPVARRRRLPRVLARAIDACLEPDPAARPPVEELARALDALLEE